jgi:hypothetical protein
VDGRIGLVVAVTLIRLRLFVFDGVLPAGSSSVCIEEAQETEAHVMIHAASSFEHSRVQDG